MIFAFLIKVCEIFTDNKFETRLRLLILKDRFCEMRGAKDYWDELFKRIFAN